MLAEINNEFDLQPRKLQFSAESKNEEISKIVLDGQQRLTAGIQLSFGTSDAQRTHYFLDLNKISELFDGYVVQHGGDIDSDETIRGFLSDLDSDTGYLVGRNASKNPHAKLMDNDLLFTPLLNPDNSKTFDILWEQYTEKKPKMKKLIRNIVRPGFVISSSTQIPYITISKEYGVEAVSRIFSTLNTTGTMLTPFELVVAILYSKGIDLREDIETGRTAWPINYPQMDKSGEIALQTAVLIDGGDPKKSKLPKTLTQEIWEKHKDSSFATLEKVGEFLTDRLGLALDKTSRYIPYDSIFTPLAAIWVNCQVESLSVEAKARAFEKLQKWVVASILSQRYQEGVHTKQISDLQLISNWITLDDDSAEPGWMGEITIPRLINVSQTGALGKFVLALNNRSTSRDPLTDEVVNLGFGDGDDHHIFPTKFVKTLLGWGANDTPNVVLNFMRLARSTNIVFSNLPPSQQIRLVIKNRGSVNSAKEAYDEQLIPVSCFEVLSKENLTIQDFKNFVALREQYIVGIIEKKFGFRGLHNVDEHFSEM